jgi:dTDP-4-dehydrorhamnose reductase
VRVAVSGANGRLGRALLAALADAPFTGLTGPIAWARPDYDLDDLTAPDRLIRRDRPETVVHAAAWTDVDGCARDPELARRRNGEAVGALARRCAANGIDLILVSTNEVFDGLRTDGRGYRPDDPTDPPNAYGVSKLAGETAAGAAFAGASAAGPAAGAPRLAIVRTAWLYGAPGDDFPAKILAAAERARAGGEPLQVVGDEYGSPTAAADVAETIVELLGSGEAVGTHHLVNAGVASRADWARELFRQLRLAVELVEVPATTWTRASTPPPWGALEPTPLPSGEPMRPWPEALADDLARFPRLAGARPR